MIEELGNHSKTFEFTQIIPAAHIYDALRVSQLGDVTRDEAIDLGRKLWAKRVVFGHFRNLRTHSDNDHYHGTIWRKFTERDTAETAAFEAW